MLANVLAGHDSFALGALYSDHLAGLFVLHNISSRALHFAVGCGLAGYAFHLLTFAIVVLQDLTLFEGAVTEKALK